MNQLELIGKAYQAVLDAPDSHATIPETLYANGVRVIDPKTMAMIARWLDAPYWDEEALHITRFLHELMPCSKLPLHSSYWGECDANSGG